MSTGEDEPSPGLNGRLRPRKSTTTTIPNPQNKPIRKAEGKIAQERPKRNSTSSKASPAKQDEIASNSDTSSTLLILCPYCDRKFSSKQTASKHARRIHLPTAKQDTFIKCLHCNQSDAESHAIIKHMVDSHPNQYFACLECYTRFPSTTELAEHKVNVCEKQKPSYRNKLRQKTSSATKKTPKRSNKDATNDNPKENAQFIDEHRFNGIVISCELKPSDAHDATDIEDKITTNLILPSSKGLSNAAMEKNAVIVLDDLNWNKRIPPNFSFHNTDADQILSRLGVVHRSPRVGESRKDLIRMMDEPNEKFEKCFDTGFYSKVAKNVQDNLAKYLDGSFNFDPNKDSTIKTRKSKTSVVINTAEGFPILLAYEQFSRNMFDGVLPRALAPKHKWKWDNGENDKNLVVLLDQKKSDSHVNNCIITLVSSLDIWTQLRMKHRYEEIYKTTPPAKKKEKQNIISLELKEILESRDIPSTSSAVVEYRGKPAPAPQEVSELPGYLGLSPIMVNCELQPAVLSGEWVRPRCYVCCACGEQTRDGRALSTHITTQHPNAQVQHYEIVGETLLSADILKHLYVPPSQISNRTRPPRGFRDCTKCQKSVTLEDLHQHMLDCAGDTPTVRKKCRYRPFGVRRRRPRLPDNTIRKKMRKDIRSRHRQKVLMRPRIRTEVGDAETIRKMIADLPAKRNRITTPNVLRPRRNIIKTKKAVRLRNLDDTKSIKNRVAKILNKVKRNEKTEPIKKQNDTDNSSTVDEDDQPLKLSAKRILTRSTNEKKATSPSQSTVTVNKTRKNSKQNTIKKDTTMRRLHPTYYNIPPDEITNPPLYSNPLNRGMLNPSITLPGMLGPLPPNMMHTSMSPPAMYPRDPRMHADSFFFNQIALRDTHYSDPALHHELATAQEMHHRRMSLEHARQNQLAMEHSMHNHYARDYAQFGAHHNQLPMDRDHQTLLANELTAQRVDVHSAESGKMRCHGNRNDYNIQNFNCPTRSNNTNQSNNMMPASNLPLKHSIAALTSCDEPQRDSTSFEHPDSQSPEIDVTAIYEPSNIQEFENEAESDKLDKPPLQVLHKDSMESMENYKARQTLTTQKSDEPLVFMEYESSKNLCGQISSTSKLLEETVKPAAVSVDLNTVNLSTMRKLNEQPIIYNAPITYHNLFDPQILANKSVKNDDKLSSENKLMHSSEFIEEQKEVEMKSDTDKTKSNKTRKGLNDCIAMLITKKVLQLECLPADDKNDKTLAKDTAKAETMSTKTLIPGTVEIETIDSEKAIEESADPKATNADAYGPAKDIAVAIDNILVTSETIDLDELTAVTTDPVKVTAEAIDSHTVIAESMNLEGITKGVDSSVTMFEKVDSTISTAESSEPALTITKAVKSVDPDSLKPTNVTCIAEDNNLKARPMDNSSNDMIPAQIFSRSALHAALSLADLDYRNANSTETRILRNSADDLMLSKIEPKRKLTRTGSLSRTDPKTENLISGHVQIDCAPLTDTRSKQVSEVNTDVSQTSTRNSYDMIQHRVSQNYNARFGMNDPNLTEAMLESQAKFTERTESLNMQIMYNQRIASEMYNQHAPVTDVVTQQTTYNQFTNMKMTPQSSSVPPASRRTRRKPIKPNPRAEKLPAFNYRRSTQEKNKAIKHTAQHESNKTTEVSSEKSTSSNFIPGTSVTIEPRNIQTVSEFQNRRETHKRVLDCIETDVNLEYARNDGSRNKMLKKSTDSHNRNTGYPQNLHHQSIELASAQSTITNYKSPQVNVYQEQREKEINVPPFVKRPLFKASCKVTPEEFIKRSQIDIARYNTQLPHSHYPPDTTFVSVNQDTGGVMLVNSEVQNVDETDGNIVPREIKDIRKMLVDEEELTNHPMYIVETQSSIQNTEEPNKDLSKCTEPTNQSTFESANVRDYPQSHEIGRSSGEYYPRLPSPYQRNAFAAIPPQHAYDKVPNMNISVAAVRAYHDSVGLPFNENLYSGSADTPLDLSRDSKARKEKETELSNTSPYFFKKPGEKNADESLTLSSHDYTQYLQNLYSHSVALGLNSSELNLNQELVASPANEIVGEMIHNIANVSKNQEDKDLLLLKKKTPFLTKRHVLIQEPVTAIAQFANSELSENHPYNSDQNNQYVIKKNSSEIHEVDRLSSHSSKYNYTTTPHPSNSNDAEAIPISITTSVKSRDNMQDKTFLENKKITRNSLTQLEPVKPEAVCNINVDFPADFKTVVNESTTNQTADNNSIEIRANTRAINISPRKENTSTDQDPETVRKIALLPKAIVDILGNIPKDHRNKLLNVLPQYVSAPTFTEYTMPDSVQNTQHKVCIEPKKLCVNTISPSSIVPKKRHSPSFGRLNSNDAQYNFSVLQQPILHRLTPIENESKNNTKNTPDDRSTAKVIGTYCPAIDPLSVANTQMSSSKNIGRMTAIVDDNNKLIRDDIDITPSQDLVQKPRNFNEQTASLRAVRIKTTRKSNSDEINLQTNYCYQINNTDEKATFSGQIPKSTHYNSQNVMNCKYDEIWNDNNDRQAETFPNITTKDIYENESYETPVINTMKSINEINKECVPDETSTPTLAQIEKKILCITDEDETVSKFSTSETLVLPTPAAYQNTSDNHADISLETNMYTPFPQSGSGKNDVIIITDQQLNLTADNKNLGDLTKSTSEYIISDKDGKDLTISPQCYSTDTYHEKTTIKSDVNVKFALSPDLPKSENEPPENNLVKFSKFVDKITKPSDEILHEIDPPTEEDSEDDVSLAVIKQKQCIRSSFTKIHSKSRRKKSKITLKSKQDVTNSQGRVGQKYSRKNKSKYIDSIKKKPFVEDMIISYEGSVNDETTIIENNIKEDLIGNCTISLPLPTVAIDTDAIKINDEFEVDKENNVTDNINKIIEDDKINDSHSSNECMLDNSVDKNSDVELNYTLDIVKCLDLNKSIVNEESVLATSCDYKKDEYTSLTEDQQKQKLKKKKLQKSSKSSADISGKASGIEIDNISNVDNRNEDNLFSSAINDISSSDTPYEKQIDPNKTRFTDIPSADSINTLSSSNSDTINESQLCSEIQEISTVTLRRSRRGKSMYIDRSYLDKDKSAKQDEDCNQKSHLTMKRLILSRVEKDKKLTSECNEKNTDHQYLSDSEVTDVLCGTYIKPAKRKISPNLKRKSKKTKPVIVQNEEHNMAASNIYITDENNSSILRELPNAENKIEELENCIEDVKSHIIPESIASKPEYSTLESKSTMDVIAVDEYKDVKEQSISGKRKLNVSKKIDLVSVTTKKTKYSCKKQSNSDFDSEDEKGLLETKQTNVGEKSLTKDNQNSTIDLDSTSQIKHDCEITVSDMVNADNSKPSNLPIETKTTCYNRFISNKWPRPSPASVTIQTNYDPYDINLEDMLETSEPVVKKKGRAAGNSKISSKNEDKSAILKIIISPLEIAKETTNMLVTTENNEYDSDSSKSDVPLQKYVKENQLKTKNNKDKCDLTANEASLAVKSIEQLPASPIGTLIEENTNCIDKINTDCNSLPCKGKRSAKEINKDVGLYEDNLDNQQIKLTTIDQQNLNTNNNIDQKQIKEKKPRRSFTTCIDDSLNISEELDQQQKSDKFMENFGFYSERIPRKSNLLASKKISETFHMISNESDDSYMEYNEKVVKKPTSNENKRKAEASSEFCDVQDCRSENTNLTSQSTIPIMDIVDPYILNETDDVSKIDDEITASTGATISLDSIEVTTLKCNQESSTQNTQNTISLVNYEPTGILEATETDERDNLMVTPGLHTEVCIKVTNNTASKKSKSKPDKPVGKEKMYPDIEDIDMFEDKFDKIKRKRRSQAVAAKQVQNTVEANSSMKIRKQKEKKKTAKNTKKSSQNTQVLTKGALKGFDGIKISIPTQDLNMPPSISPPRQQKKRKKTKMRRQTCDSNCTYSDSEDKEKSGLEKDIYEFKDNEDTELLELRPSTVMDRFRSMHNKGKLKHKDKNKVKGELNKEKIKERSKEKERKTDSNEKDSRNEEKGKAKHENESDKRNHKHVSREGRRSAEVNQHISTNFDNDSDMKMKRTKESENVISDQDMIHSKSMLGEKSLSTPTTSNLLDYDNNMEITDGTVAGTSGFVPDRMDESDYESDVSSPEGDFIFYTSNDMNCVCPSDNDSEDSDGDRSCGRPNCIYKNRNADKNAAIGNIFKNNAVRCEKPDTKEPEEPRPNLDQLFDSLFETKPDNKDISDIENKAGIQQSEQSVLVDSSISVTQDENTRKSNSPVFNPDITTASKRKTRRDKNKDISISNKQTCHEPLPILHVTPKNKNSDDVNSDDNFRSRYDSYSLDEFMPEAKSKKSPEKSLSDELHDNILSPNDACIANTSTDNVNDELLTCAAENEVPNIEAPNRITIKQSEVKFDLSVQKQHFKRYANADLSPRQTEIDVETNSVLESDSEHVSNKHLTARSVSESTDLGNTSGSTTEIQTVKSTRQSPSNNRESSPHCEINIPVKSKSRNRSQKHHASDNLQKKSSKITKTEKRKNNKHHEKQGENIDDKNDKHEKTSKESGSSKNNIKNCNSSSKAIDREMSPQPGCSFAAPARRSASFTSQHSPRQSDDVNNMSHENINVFDEPPFDDTGVARQRARRKCTVGKQNVLAEHWSSESEFDGAPPRPNSADSVVTVARKKKTKKKDGHQSGSRRGRQGTRNDNRVTRGRGASAERSDSEPRAGPSRPHIGPKIRARAAQCWSSDGEEASGPQPLHGWIVGNSHKKLVTLLANAKGRQGTSSDTENLE